LRRENREQRADPEFGMQESPSEERELVLVYCFAEFGKVKR
jgi:hypothetical protein